MELEIVGPPSKAELEPLIAKIEEGGGHYLPVGSIPAQFPIVTMATKDTTRGS